MKKILFIYPSMFIGGSTTSLLSLLNNINNNDYEIDLQMLSNSGPLMNEIPSYVNVLPEAQMYNSKGKRLIKYLKLIFTGYAFKALYIGPKYKKIGFSNEVIEEFWAKYSSKKNKNDYDLAVGFLEGWSDWYLAYCVKADNKIAWLHSTFKNITKCPSIHIPWMEKVDKIVFVTDACANEFMEEVPAMASKTVTIENVIDSQIIIKRSECIDEKDEEYLKFASENTFKIVTVCRIAMSTKGLDRIVKCAKELRHQNISFLWYIIGNGTDEILLKKAIESAGLQEYLINIGARLNPYPFIKASNIMCMPSRYEGKPIVVTESMILGVPPVVTAYLSAYDQIQNNIDGIVVPNNDEAIIDTIIACARNRENIDRMHEYLNTKDYGNKSYVKEIEKKLFEV